MKKTITGLFLGCMVFFLAFSLVGCDLLGIGGDPLVGTWLHTKDEGPMTTTATMELKKNGEFTSSVTIHWEEEVIVSESGKGIWSATDTTLTLSVVSGEIDYFYSFNSDESVLNLTPTDGGAITTYTRQ